MALVLNGSGVITGVTDLATAGVTLDDAALTDPVVTGGVYLGGTGSANYLDDYEEGTFTPTVEGSTTAGSASYSSQNGVYTKIGNLVTVNIFMSYGSHTGSGNMLVRNLPFANASGKQVDGCMVTWNTGTTYSGTVFSDMNNASTQLNIYYTAGSTATQVALPSGAAVAIHFSYRVS